ncbi:MAG TPA: hypothetical protein VJ866_21630 [Pyrinomonadaceae bacterium]|nr:hypothetical protein [Pyrinomonadaceae bacterium]
MKRGRQVWVKTLREALGHIPEFFSSRAARRCLLALFLCLVGAQAARAQVTVTPVTWNVIGLDSNKWSQGVGPDTFQVGARACNVGATAVPNITGTLVWDSSNPYINLATGALNPVTYNSLPVGTCTDFYFPVVVSRVNAVFTTNPSRRYHITVSGTGVSSVSTPTPRELYVEQLLSQNRNTVTSITGPTSVYVGQSYTFRLIADTATQGYDQLEAFINLSNVVFQVQSISTTYSAPAGATNDKFYGDACGWNNVPGSAGYLDCTNSGKVGGTIVTDYTVKILAVNGGPITLGALILDHSGGSFHYNADNGDPAKQITINVQPPPLTLSKTASASPVLTNGTLTYTLRVTNSGNVSYTLSDFVDTPPTSPGTPAYVAGSSKFNGAAIANPTASGGKLTWSGSFVVPASSTRDLTYQMTMPNTHGSYSNSAIAHFDGYQLDTTQDVTDNVPASATVQVNTPPSIALCKTVVGQTCPPPATPLSQLPGTDVNYRITFVNNGDTAAQQFVLIDPDPSTTLKLNTNTDFKVGSVVTVLGSLTSATVAYSNDSGATWTYVPASGAGGAPAGYDRNVTHIRFSFAGSLTSASNGSVTFTVRIR